MEIEHNQAIQDLTLKHQIDTQDRNSSLRALQAKLAESKAIAQKAMKNLEDDQRIDKRIITSWIISFIKSHIEKRNDVKDQIHVISNLLEWDEKTKEMAGLIPKPYNTSTFTNRNTQTNSDTQPMQKSLTSMWVDFLLDESSP